MTRQTLITLALGSCTLGLLPAACNNGTTDADKTAETAPAIRVFPIIRQDVTDYGEWFGYLHRDGRLSSRLKGNVWKGPFHLPRMLWYCTRLLEEKA